MHRKVLGNNGIIVSVIMNIGFQLLYILKYHIICYVILRAIAQCGAIFCIVKYIYQSSLWTKISMNFSLRLPFSTGCLKTNHKQDLPICLMPCSDYGDCYIRKF